jgi:hypothetical protein
MAGFARPWIAGGRHVLKDEGTEGSSSRGVTGVAAVLTVGPSAASGAAVTSGHGEDGGHVRLDQVFIIVLENHSQHSVIGDPNTPFITSLAQEYGQATDYC